MLRGRAGGGGRARAAASRPRVLRRRVALGCSCCSPARGGPAPARRSRSTCAAASRPPGGPPGSACASSWRRRSPPRWSARPPALPLAALAPGRLGLRVVLLAPAAGFLGPDLWLGRLAAERGAGASRRELPALLDLLRVTSRRAARWPGRCAAVGERAEGPLAREWSAVAREVGARRSALARPSTASRSACPQPEIRAFVAALDRASRHGAPLADTLAAQARAARFALARRIREDAARAGPKIQLVVALLLVPSVLLLVAAALAAALLDGSGEALPLYALRGDCSAEAAALTYPPKRRFARNFAFRAPPAREYAPSAGPRPTPHHPPFTALQSQKRPDPSDAWPRVGRKSGESCCRVGESGVRWRPAIDRSGGAPPTPPLRSEPSPGDMTVGVSWPLRALAGREEPAQHSGPVPRGLLQWNRSRQGPGPLRRRLDPRRRTRRIVERALGALNPIGADYRKLSRFFQGNSFDIELDATGRVTLPPPLLAHSDI